MTDPKCVHGHPAWGCPDLRVEWDPLTVPEEYPRIPLPSHDDNHAEGCIGGKHYGPCWRSAIEYIGDEPTTHRDQTLILLAVLAIAVIAVIAWSAR